MLGGLLTVPTVVKMLGTWTPHCLSGMRYHADRGGFQYQLRR